MASSRPGAARAGERVTIRRTVGTMAGVRSHPAGAAGARARSRDSRCAQGDLAGARAAYERALAIDERVHGPDHPKVAMRVTNLGDVLKDQGDLAGAKAAYERALAIFRRQLGEHHRHTEFARRSLATVATSPKTSSSIVDGP
jgi:tetratricopeptide (TPR) repeat protein